MSKDRARPFSRKHRRYWIPVTGGMLLIGAINVAIGFCSYHPPSDVHERIMVNVPGPAAAPAPIAVPCAPAIAAPVAAELPGATITVCTPAHVTAVHDDHAIDLELANGQIVSIAQRLSLPEIPAAVMRAFAVAYPRTIPSAAVKRTVRGAEPVYELRFPPGAGHTQATLRADGSVVELR